MRRQDVKLKILNLLPKGAILESYGESKDRIIIGRMQWQTYFFIYKFNGETYRSRVKGHKI